MNLYGFAGGDPVNFSDPFGLFACDPPDSPLCKKGPILILSYGATAAVSTIGANLQTGFAMNLRTGDAAALVQGGNTVGVGLSYGPQLTVQSGTLADVIAASPDAPLSEGGVSFSGSGGRGTVTVGVDGKRPSGVSVGTNGIGAFANLSAGGKMTPTINLHKNLDRSFTCAKVGVGCTP